MRKTRRKHEALELLAKKGPMNVYQVWKWFQETRKTSKGSRSAYQKAVNSLMKEGYVNVKKSKAWYGGRTMKVYGITVEGFLEALKEKTLWGHIDQIVSSNKQLMPEYFEFWDTLKRLKADDVGVKLLAYAIEKLKRGVPTFPEQIEGRKPTLRDWLPRAAIYPYDAMLEGVLSRMETSRFLRAILEDDKAEKLYVDTLKWIIRSHKSAMESFSGALEKHRELKYWLDKTRRVVEIIENIQDPAERLKALKQDKDLWQAVLRLYPEVKDEEGLLVLFEKIKSEKSKA